MRRAHQTSAASDDEPLTAASARFVARSSVAAAAPVSRSQAKSQWSETQSPGSGSATSASPPSRQRTSRCVHAPRSSVRPSQTSGRSRTRAVSRVDELHERGRRAAAVEHSERLVDDARPQQPEPGIDGEDVERVVRDARRPRPRRGRVPSCGRCRPRKRSSTWRASAPGVTRSRSVVADPVGLDDAGVERVGDPVRAGDQRQIRPCALERARELGEASVGGACVAVLEQRPRLVGAAVAERVRRVRVAREEERPGGHARRPAERRA